MAFWYNIKTEQVETDENRSRGQDVLGPYDTYEDASAALITAAENTERWDDEDEAWENMGAADLPQERE